MDINKLRIQVFEKTGIKVDTNDPIFALVALNEAVLTECVEQHVTELHTAANQLQEQTRQFLEAGDRVKTLLLQMGQTVEDPHQTIQPGKSQECRKEQTFPWKTVATVGATSILSAVLVLCGMTAFDHSRQQPVTVTSSPITHATPH